MKCRTLTPWSPCGPRGPWEPGGPCEKANDSDQKKSIRSKVLNVHINSLHVVLSKTTTTTIQTNTPLDIF